MQLSILVTTFLLSGVLAIAGNARRDEFQPTDASLTCMFMTNDYHWHGEGQNICEIAGQCATALPDGLTKNVSSAGPDPGMTCFLYDAPNCQGTCSAPIVWPGYGNLSEPTIDFNKRVQSWQCWKYCGYMSSSASASLSGPAPAATSSTLYSDDGGTIVHTLTLPWMTISSSATTLVSITSTIGGGPASSSTMHGPSSGTRNVNVFGTVLTHTFADGSTELTTMALVTPT